MSHSDAADAARYRQIVHLATEFGNAYRQRLDAGQDGLAAGVVQGFLAQLGMHLPINDDTANAHAMIFDLSAALLESLSGRHKHNRLLKARLHAPGVQQKSVEELLQAGVAVAAIWALRDGITGDDRFTDFGAQEAVSSMLAATGIRRTTETMGNWQREAESVEGSARGSLIRSFATCKATEALAIAEGKSKHDATSALRAWVIEHVKLLNSKQNLSA